MRLEYNKFIVALVGLIVNTLVAIPVSGPWQPVVTGLVALATALGVYQTPNVFAAPDDVEEDFNAIAEAAESLMGDEE